MQKASIIGFGPFKFYSNYSVTVAKQSMFI